MRHIVLGATEYVHGSVVHFRQIQAALYTMIMSIGLDTVTSHSEMCGGGQIIKICKYNVQGGPKKLLCFLTVSNSRTC